MKIDFKGFFRSRLGKIIIIVVAAIILLNFVFLKKNGPEYVVTEAVKGNIIQTVDVTGSIKADPSLDLHFKKTGTVNEIFVEEGFKVSKDDLLATLENTTLALQVDSQNANLSFARAQYNQTSAGAKYEEIKIAEAEVLSAKASYDAALVEIENTRQIGEKSISLAEIAYETAEKDLENTIALAEKEIANLEISGDTAKSVALENAYDNAQTILDSLITILQDSMFLSEDIIGIRGDGFVYLTLTKKTNIKKNYHEDAKEDYDTALDSYQSLTINSEDSEIDQAILDALIAADSNLLLLSQIGYELENINLSNTTLENLILEVSNQSISLSNSTLSLQDAKSTIETLKVTSEEDIDTLTLSYQLQIDQAESKYIQAENNLSQTILNTEIYNKNAEALVALKKAAYDSAVAMLSLKQSPARAVDLAPLAAKISQAEIALKISQNALEDSQIFAPIEGIVTFIYGEIGENISLTEASLTPFLSIQADKLIVEANVPETDVVKITEGDKVELTIDAFDFTEKFKGEVIYIDPAETIIQGVIYYGIKTAFDIEDPRIKSGMTVNLEIITDVKENVLTIPTRAVKYEDNIRYVEVLNNGTPKKVEIKTGLESDQFTEVTEGLKEGDKIITFVK